MSICTHAIFSTPAIDCQPRWTCIGKLYHGNNYKSAGRVWIAAFFLGSAIAQTPPTTTRGRTCTNDRSARCVEREKAKRIKEHHNGYVGTWPIATTRCWQRPRRFRSKFTGSIVMPYRSSVLTIISSASSFRLLGPFLYEEIIFLGTEPTVIYSIGMEESLAA